MHISLVHLLLFLIGGTNFNFGGAKMRKNLSTLLLCFLVFILFSGCSGNSRNSTAKKEAQEVAATEEMGTLSAKPDSVSPSTNTDLEIITRDGHPTYYGSVESSHAIWDGTEKGKIIFADSYDKYSEGVTILTMDAYQNSDLIRSIEIYFSNFEEPIDLNLDEVLKIAASYMPFEIMNTYYQYNNSELVVPDEGQDGDNYYIISYNLTDEGKAAYYSKEHEYSGTIDVIIQVDRNDTIQNVIIGFGTPRWMSSLSINSYHKEEWVCDLYDFR